MTSKTGQKNLSYNIALARLPFHIYNPIGGFVCFLNKKGGCKIKKLFLSLFACVLMCSVAFAGPLDFVLVNKTGVDVYYVYISNSSNDNWGDDVMDDDILPDGGSVTIRFPGKQGGALWDIRVENEDGDPLEWYEFDLKSISKITLNKDGEAQYE